MGRYDAAVEYAFSSYETKSTERIRAVPNANGARALARFLMARAHYFIRMQNECHSYAMIKRNI